MIEKTEPRFAELQESGSIDADETPTPAVAADDETVADAEARKDEALSFEALLISRTYLYTLFHKALGGEPCGRLFELLSDEQTVSVVDEYASADSAMATLKDYFAGLAEKADGEFVDDARSEYTRVFVGPNRLLALPWESPYVSHESVLFQKNTLAVRHAYNAHGWKIKRHLHVPDDHVSLMCGFMARLANESMISFEEPNLQDVRDQMIEQKLFIDGHLNNWLSKYAEGLCASGKAPLYSRLVEGLTAFVRLDSVFAVEAISWIDELSKWEEEAGEGVSVSIGEAFSPDSDLFDAVKEALARLAALRLKDVEDNELCDL